MDKFEVFSVAKVYISRQAFILDSSNSFTLTATEIEDEVSHHLEQGKENYSVLRSIVYREFFTCYDNYVVLTLYVPWWFQAEELGKAIQDCLRTMNDHIINICLDSVSVNL